MTGMPSPHQEPPALTVILPTLDTFNSISKTVNCVAAQTVAGVIELIICAPVAVRVQIDDDAVATLHSVRVLEAGELHATGPLRADAIREATAPIVAFAEDHCFPYPDWAAALLAAHAEPHAAVGPAVYNANPETATSWADLYLGYGRWLAPGRRGEVDLLPGHNSSYKRDVLIGYGEELDRLMEAETVLLWDLRRNGHTLLFEPAARVDHTNFAHFGVFIDVQWHLGRVFGATRSANWPLHRRVAYAAGAPLIPLIRLGHVITAGWHNRFSARRFIVALPVLLAGLGVDCVAQATGALFGPAGSVDRLSSYEFHRNEVNRTGRRPAAG